MTYFLLFTAITVSIDSFFCGFSLALNKAKKLPVIFLIAITVFLMCLITNYSAELIRPYLTEKTACIGGLILIFVGIYNLLKKDKDYKVEKNFFTQSLIIGFAVGLDGALANLSLALMGINAFYVPIIFALMHALTIALGILLARTKFVAGLNKIGFLPPLILIALGIYKIAGFFI